MTTELTIEQRLTVVERAVADLQSRLATVTSSPDWLEKLDGSCAGVPGFEEMIELGRAFRQSDRPADEDGSAS